MLNRAEAVSRDDVFLPVSRRRTGGVYFLRLSEYSAEAEDYIWRFHEEARQRGAIVEDQISNPDDRQMSYYTDILGTAFRPDEAFVTGALQKWMPRMSPAARTEFARAMCRQLAEMKAAGKNESIQKNVYIKMMCWLYYRFERLMPFLGSDNPPKILYEGSTITNHELVFLKMLMSMGADILLVEVRGDGAYMRLDPSSAWSQKLAISGGRPFPADFSLKKLRKDRAQREAANRQAQAQPARQTPAQRQPAQAAPRQAQPARTTPQTTPARQTPAAGQMPAAQHNPASEPRRTTAQGQRIDLESRFPAPGRNACTNAWMKTPEIDQILLPPMVRGDDHSLFFNAFIRMRGVKDKLTYVNELYQLYQNLKTNGRKVLIIDGQIPVPDTEELDKVRRRSYREVYELIVDLAGNLPTCSRTELQRSIQRAFIRTIREAAKEEPNLNRLTITAVYIICWIKRYQAQLFQGWKETEIPCFFKMGPCATVQEAMFALFLSQLPVDVIVLSPNLNETCMLKADTLLEITGNESLPVMNFPRQNGSVQMRTVASHAEQELTTMLYTDSGIYRNRQFGEAETITLRTTYDEIFILWDQELKYRPNFSTGSHAANIPVIYAKISGVEDGKTLPYWHKIKQLKDRGDTLFINQMPFIQPGETNKFQALATKGIKNGKIRTREIKEDRLYPFGLLREEMQEHIFDKIQQMLDQRLIKGTFTNGTEFTVLATVLNMKKELLRLIQGFDFTKKNPKIVVIHTRDQSPSLQDAIMLTFLNRLGFDIVMFVPTGYQTIERYLEDNFPVEHEIGEYIYDLVVPDLDTLPQEKGHKWINSVLKAFNG